MPFSFPGHDNPVMVDVICNSGYTWVKAVARKPQALHLIWAGAGQFGDRCVTKQAELYLECAKLYPRNFTPPSTRFVFYAGLTKPLFEELESMGVKVEGDVVEINDTTRLQLTSDVQKPEGYVDSDVCRGIHLLNRERVPFNASATEDICCEMSSVNLSCQSEVLRQDDQLCRQSNFVEGSCQSVVSPFGVDETDNVSSSDTRDTPTHAFHQKDSWSGNEACSQTSSPSVTAFPDVPAVTKVNLDVSTLICLTSNVCHGHCNFIFKDNVLRLQAEEEMKKPLLPELTQFLSDKEKFVCETALTIFQNIVATVGGPSEKLRAKKLLQQVTVVPDQVSCRTNSISKSAKINQRSKVIFGTGDSIKAVTMTANSGFVRAAAHQGVNYAVWIHGSRAFTEQKEAFTVTDDVSC